MRCTNPKCPSWATKDLTAVPNLPRVPKIGKVYVRTCKVCGESANHVMRLFPGFGLVYHSIESVRVAKEA